MSVYNKLSEERKRLQEQGQLPEWYTTAGWQLFKEKYLNANTPKEQYQRIAKAASYHTDNPDDWYHTFFNMLWNGWLSPATPVLTNMGGFSALPVSCGGNYTPDSIDGIYSSLRESAILSKNGFGTSTYLGDIRHRGSEITGGGTSTGVLPVIVQMREMAGYVSQGNARRGSIACYLPIDHGDFDEVADFIVQDPDSLNIGWNVSDAFIHQLESGDKEAIRRYQKAMKIKAMLGKGYFSFIDKMNHKNPLPISIKASNLCNEITLPADDHHSFTCVLSSLNLAKYDEWKDTQTPYNATVFLDAVAEEFIQRAKNIPGMERAVAFTKKARALGLGVMGFHSLLQQRRHVWGTFEAMQLNTEIFSKIAIQSEEASRDMAKLWGEPEWLKGTGLHNSHRIAIAPTKSTGLIMGGVSEGINPDTAYVYTQKTAGGDVQRINPELLKLARERDMDKKPVWDRIRSNMGSVQGEDWLSQHEKEVFKTAFEINQHSVITMASQRARWIDQWQSLNLFFSADEDEEVISAVHKQAFLDPNILGLYYIYSQSGVQAANDKDECLACQ